MRSLRTAAARPDPACADRAAGGCRSTQWTRSPRRSRRGGPRLAGCKTWRYEPRHRQPPSPLHRRPPPRRRPCGGRRLAHAGPVPRRLWARAPCRPRRGGGGVAPDGGGRVGGRSGSPRRRWRAAAMVGRGIGRGRRTPPPPLTSSPPVHSPQLPRSPSASDASPPPRRSRRRGRGGHRWRCARRLPPLPLRRGDRRHSARGGSRRRPRAARGGHGRPPPLRR